MHSKLLNLDISDKLTTVSCGHIVVEIIKFIAYQRLQIPYTYQWLKQIVTKNRIRMENGVKDSFQSERHFRTVSTALDNLDFILKSLLQEISGPTMPLEVCLTLGASPVTCKEVYRLILPTLCHKPQCHSTHILKDQKLQCSVFRTLVTSEMLNQAFTTPLQPTNMHVFIQKKVNNEVNCIMNSDNFLPASGSRLPKSCKLFVIDFRNPNNENVACCNDFEIFTDTISNGLTNMSISRDAENSEDQFNEIQSNDEMKWYQSTYTMKGFKDCIVDGSSVTNKWLEN